METDLFAADAILLDRSTLERWATCPHAARLVELGNGKSASEIAAVGNEAHDALSRALLQFVDSEGNIERSDLARAVRSEVASSRPDVLPQTERAIRSAIWDWSSFFDGLHPGNILGFDGGEGSRNSQVGRDIQIGTDTIRCTSEIDLLLSTESPEVIEEIDYKTGWKEHTSQTVKDSFQFRFHWWLLSEKYPKIKCLRCRVWNTRKNRLTYVVEFDRDVLPSIHAQVLSAAGEWFKWHGKPVEKVPAWPFEEKCSICPVRVACKHVDRDISEFTTHDQVDWLAATYARVSEVEKRLGKIVDSSGEEITTAAGNCFGVNAPKTNRKPPKKIYTAAKSDDELPTD